MEYLEFLTIVNERIRQGKIFSKMHTVKPYKKSWRDYMLFIQPTEVSPNDYHNFSPMFSVLLDGSGRTCEEQKLRGGLGLNNTFAIEDLTLEDYNDFARCLKSRGLKFNRKLNTIVKDD